MTASINADRLMADLRDLADIGKDRTGVHRPALSPEDLEARRWIAGRMEEAGLSVSMDRLGTTVGRFPGVSQAVIIGSHTDTVPHGGWLDGALGVVYGLEVARALLEAGETDGLGVDVVNFQDEEGTFVPCLGSGIFFGEIDLESMHSRSDAQGRVLGNVLKDAGTADLLHSVDPARHVGYLEAHIEQGPRLENGGIGVGVVGSIVGIRRFKATAEGREDHAGTTPMNLRRDAGAALLHLGSEVHRRFHALGYPDTVWNTGSIGFSPGAPNVVPKSGELIIEFRAPSVDTLDSMEAEIRDAGEWAAGQSGAGITIDRTADVAPTPMDAGMVEALRQAARDLQIAVLDLPSGAGHDAMVAARHLPSGLMFTPCINGRSHTIEEDAHEADIIRGCQVMLQVIRRLRATA
jgi:beta-ureidopropionase / N-carbamoyl-L-amino-acid hydrolase